MKKYSAIFLCVILFGCAAPQKPSFEKMSKQLSINKAAATREYKGKSQKEVLEASHKALYMLDQGYYIDFDISENKVYAKRIWGIFLILSSVNGVDQYNVSAEKTKQGVNLTFAFSSESMPYIMPPNSFKKNLEVGYMENPADFKLFHDRVEYFLGIRKDWVTCDVAKAKQPDPKKEMFLCDSIGLENISPDNPLAIEFTKNPVMK